MEKYKPKASVLMPIHRVDNFLNLAIESVLNQSYRDFELILILNGLCNEKINYVKNNYIDCRIKIITTSFTKLFHCLNQGLDISRGEYIIRMDSDDIASQNRFEEQIKFMEINRNIGICASFYNLIDENSNIIELKNKINITDDADIKKYIRYQTTIAHPSVIARRVDLLLCSGYSNIDFVEDWDLWLRAVRKNINFSIIPNVLLSYRVHKNQITSLDYNKEKYLLIISLLTREFLFTRNINFIFSILYNTYLYFGVNAKKFYRQLLLK